MLNIENTNILKSNCTFRKKRSSCFCGDLHFNLHFSRKSVLLQSFWLIQTLKKYQNIFGHVCWHVTRFTCILRITVDRPWAVDTSELKFPLHLSSQKNLRWTAQRKEGHGVVHHVQWEHHQSYLFIPSLSKCQHSD